MAQKQDGGNEMMMTMFNAMMEQSRAHNAQMVDLIKNMPRGGGGRGCCVM